MGGVAAASLDSVVPQTGSLDYVVQTLLAKLVPHFLALVADRLYKKSEK